MFVLLILSHYAHGLWGEGLLWPSGVVVYCTVGPEHGAFPDLVTAAPAVGSFYAALKTSVFTSFLTPTTCYCLTSLLK